MQHNNFILCDDERGEVLKLVDILKQHKQEYKNFNSFCKTCNDALLLASALLNGDYKTFKTFKLKYSNHSAEKMRGIMSLSTYKKTSGICKFLSACGGICAKCYADRSLKLYKSTLTPVLIYNTLLLKYIDIDAAQVPYINDRFFRFEAFSDLQGSKHFKNLLVVCNKNKHTLFTLWTKAGMELNKFMHDENIKKLPPNLNIIISAYHINKPDNIEYLRGLQTCLYSRQAVTGRYTNALKNFVVYDDEKKRAASGHYLCKNKCIDCLKCYKKTKNIIYIAEKIH